MGHELNSHEGVGEGGKSSWVPKQIPLESEFESSLSSEKPGVHVTSWGQCRPPGWWGRRVQPLVPDWDGGCELPAPLCLILALPAFKERCSL